MTVTVTSLQVIAITFASFSAAYASAVWTKGRRKRQHISHISRRRGEDDKTVYRGSVTDGMKDGESRILLPPPSQNPQNPSPDHYVFDHPKFGFWYRVDVVRENDRYILEFMTTKADSHDDWTTLEWKRSENFKQRNMDYNIISLCSHYPGRVNVFMVYHVQLIQRILTEEITVDDPSADLDDFDEDWNEDSKVQGYRQGEGYRPNHHA